MYPSMAHVENTTHSFRFIGKVSGRPAWRMDLQKMNMKAVKGFIALLLCFLAGVVTAFLLLYTFF